MHNRALKKPIVWRARYILCTRKIQVIISVTTCNYKRNDPLRRAKHKESPGKHPDRRPCRQAVISSTSNDAFTRFFAAAISVTAPSYKS